MKLSAVVFDLDNTLYWESEYFGHIFSQFCKNNQIDNSIFQFLFDDFDYYRFNKKDIFRFALEHVSLFSEKFHNELFELFVSIECKLTPFVGVQDWMNFCIGKDIKIAVLTNGIIGAQENKWKCLPLKNKNLIDFVPARTFQFEKPSEIAFNGICKRLHLQFNELCFVGDRFQNDIEFGMKNGSQGILIHPSDRHNSIPSFSNVEEAFLFFQSQFTINR